MLAFHAIVFAFYETTHIFGEISSDKGGRVAVVRQTMIQIE